MRDNKDDVISSMQLGHYWPECDHFVELHMVREHSGEYVRLPILFVEICSKRVYSPYL